MRALDARPAGRFPTREMFLHRTLPVVVVLALGIGGCGGSAHPEETTPNEHLDLEAPHHAAGNTTPIGPAAMGTRWRFTEASCTEGPLDLGRRGFQQELRISADARGTGPLLVFDQAFTRENCVQTVVMSATPRPGGTFRIVEEARVSLPASDPCESAVRSDPPRPGEVRMNGSDLEILIQRSNWCNGFEVRFAYQPMPPAPLADDQIVRRFVAHYDRRDTAGIASLFSDGASLVEPFQLDDVGEPTRHEGRAEVKAWLDRSIGDVPWIAMHLTAIHAGGIPGHVVADWEYMDPRLTEPFAGRGTFVIAEGEIFEYSIELTRPPPGSEAAAPIAPAAAAHH